MHGHAQRLPRIKRECMSIVFEVMCNDGPNVFDRNDSCPDGCIDLDEFFEGVRKGQFQHCSSWMRFFQ